MKTNDKKTHKVYLRNLNQWVEVTYQEYLDFNRDIWAYRKKAQYHKRCMCPKSKIWICDMDCYTCPFYSTGDTYSLDCEASDGSGEWNSWIEDLEDVGADIHSIVEDRDLLAALLTELEKLFDHQQEICTLIMAGKSENVLI